ncbi:S-layer homology domain-containing protein [Paenibacillus sp. HB172176]|uniref:S-layer homology domain-containing protein n=1 Tax=Paenibacillus sp. HB172176 TaxID=2493690 RepID=UPI00143AC399|nr:S-layer homology domain-containing protein [Paenibacillus sp. HB172176]
MTLIERIRMRYIGMTGRIVFLLIILHISLLPAFGAVPSALAAADSSSYHPEFHIALSETSNRIQVVISADDLEDMYAYDLTLLFDPQQLKLIETKNGNNGFAVDPRIEDREIHYAFTKLGKHPGVNGSVILATFVMERVGTGASKLQLTRADLVKSDLTMESFEPQVTASVKAAKFLDIAGHWAENSIMEAVELGFINGYTDGTFRPEREVTRAEFVTMAARALHTEVEAYGADETGEGAKGNGASSHLELNFVDADKIPAWAAPYVRYGVDKGWISGYADGTFGADRNITRTEMTVILVRALGLSIREDETNLANFIDQKEIPAFGIASVNIAVQAGIIHGREGNHFAPLALTKRAEAVTLLLNALGSV